MIEQLESTLTGIRPEFDFGASDDFLRDGMLDSLDIVMLVSALDQRFGISIAGIDIVPENFRNLGAIDQLVRKYRTQ